MATLWEKIKTGLRETITIGVEKTEELTKVGKIKFDILMIKRQLKDELAKLGGFIYEKQKQEMNNEIFELDEYKEIIEKLKELERELHQKEDQLEFINLEKKEMDKVETETTAAQDIEKLKEEIARLEEELKKVKGELVEEEKTE